MAKLYRPVPINLTASPSRPIEGVVRDSDSGAPIPGATIRSFRLADQAVSNNSLIRTTTDASGRFRMTGMPLGQGNQVLILPPSDQPYVPSFRKLDEVTATGPLRVEWTLKRGVWIEGRVTDRVTGQPVEAGIRYAAARDNPRLDEATGFAEIEQNGDYTMQTPTAKDGTYRIAALPGRGLLVVESWDDTLYNGPGLMSRTRIERGEFVPHLYSGDPFAEIDVRPGRPAPRGDVSLVPARTIEGTILDPQGRPLSGTRVNGIWENSSWSWPLESSTFQIYGITTPKSPSIAVILRSEGLGEMASAILPERPRVLLFQNEARKLAGRAQVAATTKGPVIVHLEPWATLSGRMVTRAGEPRTHRAFQPTVIDPLRLGLIALSHHPERLYTDEKGHFRVEGLVPGLGFRLMLETALGVNTGEGPSIAPLKPGENRDLGDLIAEVPGEAD